MRFVIVTGMSGAGKSSALKTLEDAGYFCVDNLPVALLDKFADMLLDETAKIENVALGIDIRNGRGIGELAHKLKEIEAAGIKYEILYLNASNRILLKRYKETRRNHPLSRDGRVEDGIAKEREIMKFLQDQATYVIDTSQLLTRELKEEIDRIFVDGEEGERFQIAVVSFGFKHGIPADVDLVFDVRFLPNPYYDLNLRPLTGNDKPIQDFVMKHEESVEFLDKLDDMMRFLIPNYIKEGKYNLVIGIGCTGGKHRSVTITNKLAERLKQLPYSVKEEDSGVHFMMKLKTERTEMDMMSDSKSKGIKLAPLSKYFVGQTSNVNFQNVYVMNYSSIDLEQLPLIFDALCQVLIK